MTALAPFATDITVRFRDVDAFGHVNNAVMITYFEEGRKAFFLEHIGTKGADGFNFILAHISCDYLLPIRLENTPRLRMWVTHIGSKSFKLAYELAERTHETRIYSRGESVQVCFDYAKNRSVPVSEGFREKLEVFYTPGE